MIEKERLEELIEQGATIWDDVHCQIKLINDSKHKISLLANALYVAEQFENCTHTNTWWEDYTIGFYDLYENEEDSKWAEEFGCIERTERLELPTWEEFETFFEFKDKDGCDIVLVQAYGKLTLTKYNKDNIPTYQYFSEKATKENYTLVCRKCKELFLGQSNNS